MAPPGYVGRYINLDRSPDRRRDMEDMIGKLGLADRYERFVGVEGRDAPPHPGVRNPSELGCLLSHLGVISAGAATDRWLHVLEDDAVISRFAGPVIEALIASPDVAAYDIVFTNTRLSLDVAAAARLRGLFDASVMTAATGEVTSVRTVTLVPLATVDFVLATSYLVNPRSIAKTAELLSYCLDNEPFTAIDNVFSRLSRSGRLSMACTVPFLTLARWGIDSTTHGAMPPWSKGNRIIEAALYAGRNVAEIRQFIQELDRSTPTSLTTELMTSGFRHLIRS
jgi:GR25 family glycosyltransferase involved in LPS biosynthesis